MSTETPRHPIGFANYPGDVQSAIERDMEQGRPFGPNYLGEQMWPTTVEYRASEGATRVGFTLVPPVEVTR